MSEKNHRRCWHRVRATGHQTRRIEGWLEAEAGHSVPAAEHELTRVFARLPRAAPRAGFATRVMAAAAAEGIVPAEPRRSRLRVAIAVGLSAVVAVATWQLVLGLPSKASSELLASSASQLGAMLVEVARALRVVSELAVGLRLSAMVLLSSPGGALAVLVSVLACAGGLAWLARLLAEDACDGSKPRLEVA